MEMHGRSTAGKVRLAIALWLGFYMLSFGTSAGLLLFAWWLLDTQVLTARPDDGVWLHLLLAGGSTVAALTILWSSFPRWTKFRAPGPKLDPARHPALFEEIRRVARDCRQKPPDHVYLTFQVNAGVGDRGRFLGLFRVRELLIGLPLLRILTQSHFRCVLAHEFGHFAGGDTAFLPWVRRVHVALHRTVAALEGNDSIWRFPFLAYARLFLRITLDVSRRQEFLADGLSARVGGLVATCEALKRIHRAGAAFPAFVDGELAPVLNGGHRPPIADGFARFLESAPASRQLSRLMSVELRARPDASDDTHPPLALRLEALRGYVPGPVPRADPPALALLHDLDLMEEQLLDSGAGGARVHGYPRVSWEEAAEKALLPQWREAVRSFSSKLKGITPASAPDVDLTVVGRRIDLWTDDRAARIAAMQAIGTAMIVALKDRGWGISALPGDPITMTLDGVKVMPMNLFVDLAEGKLTRAEWSDACNKGGIADVNLGLTAQSTA